MSTRNSKLIIIQSIIPEKRQASESSILALASHFQFSKPNGPSFVDWIWFSQVVRLARFAEKYHKISLFTSLLNKQETCHAHINI